MTTLKTLILCSLAVSLTTLGACRPDDPAESPPPAGAPGESHAVMGEKVEAEKQAPAEAPAAQKAQTAQVDPKAEPAAGDRAYAELAADKRISDAIRTAIREAPELSPEARTVTVATRDGVVTLKGAIRSVQDKLVLEELARKAEGVHHVVTQPLEVQRLPTN